MKLAIFDFDGTIIKENAGFRWTLIMLYKFSLKSLFIGLLYVIRICSYDVWIKNVICDLKNESVIENMNYYKRHLKNLPKFKYNKNVIKKLINLSKNGYKIVIITQSIDFSVSDYVKNLEKDFNVKVNKLYCTKTIIKNDRFTNVISLVGKNKYKYFKNVDLNESYFFTDSSRDQNLLEKVKYAFVVNPNPMFWLKAKIKGWEVIKD